MLAFELVQPGRVYLVAGDAAEEEVIAEQPAGPAQVRAASGIGNRVQVGGGNGKPGFFAQLPRRGVNEALAFFEATARREPSIVGMDQQRVRSYLDTARRHGIHPLDAIRDALGGNPWMPAQAA